MSDGRFSSKPIRSEGMRAAAWRTDEISADARRLPDFARAFLESRAVQREINALKDHPFPDVGALARAPLHKSTPDGAMELGRPLASAALVQEYLIGLLFLRVAGWVFMAFGALFVLVAIVASAESVLNPRNAREPNPFFLGIAVSGVGLAIGGAGAWFGIFRGRVITEMCWFCPRGMIWMTESVFDWYTWEEVREVYCQLNTVRPAIGIRFDDNLSLISFSDDRASRQMVKYIENRASAACAPMVLQLIAEGRTVRFGHWRLSRSALRSADTEMSWRDVTDVQARDREIRIGHRVGGYLTIAPDEVPYRSLFTALACAIHAYERASLT